LTETTLRSGGSLSVSGPAAVVVLDGQVVVIDGTRSSSLEAQSGTTIGGGVGATVRAASGGARVVIVEVRGSV
jgi:hypothetical protein